MFNPYESPIASNEDRPERSSPFLTRQRVFWLGIGLIMAALITVTGSHALFVESRRANGVWDTFVIIVDCLAGLAFFTGLISLAVYHWFPDPCRKYSWRRKQISGTFHS